MIRPAGRLATHEADLAFNNLHEVHISKPYPSTVTGTFSKSLVVGRFKSGTPGLWINIRNGISDEIVPDSGGFGLQINLENVDQLIADLQALRDLTF